MKATDLERAERFLDEELSDPESGFSIGVSGAIAEFMRSNGEAELRREGPVRTVTTRDGAMRVALTPEVVPVAAESPSRRPEYWQQQVAFCLAEDQAAMGGRRVLTELGTDADAIDASGRRQLRFDLGLGLRHVDACIRTDDTQLIAVLRRLEGRALFTDAREACDVIIARSPPRVFCSRLGRIEVFAPIPQRKTPAGPHTHLLPELFHRASPIADFIPEGLVSCLDLYPANPLRKLSGENRSFDSRRHARFQKVLDAWGPPDYLAEKRRVAEWVRKGRTPDECPPVNGPLAKLGRRVAARQLGQIGTNEKTLRAWQRALETA
ncbi:MAG: hypothetical protein OER43_05095 [Gammaproteobacteria bacterium]|nr:hypothetical protein [Gammaproteobacteria bacterium]MDH3411333.1 hypothetical protein [Gammaproteobacteria bacterium]